jgi:hypothetical protein
MSRPRRPALGSTVSVDEPGERLGERLERFIVIMQAISDSRTPDRETQIRVKHD